MTSSSSRALCVVVIMGIGCAGVVFAQGQRDTTGAANSLADLTTERYVSSALQWKSRLVTRRRPKRWACTCLYSKAVLLRPPRGWRQYGKS
jgi:hypothetical protein